MSCSCTRTYSCRSCVKTNYCSCKVNPCTDKNKPALPEYNYTVDIEANKKSISDLSVIADTLKEKIEALEAIDHTHTDITDVVEDIEKLKGYLAMINPYVECGKGIRASLDIGEWSQAYITADTTSCAIGGIPSTVDQRIPLNEGDVTRHNGNLWLSLIDDNISEPSNTNSTFLNLSNIRDIHIADFTFDGATSELIITDTEGVEFKTSIGDIKLSQLVKRDGVLVAILSDGTEIVTEIEITDNTDTKVVDFKIEDGWYVVVNSDGTEHKVSKTDPYDGVTVIEQQLAKNGANFTFPADEEFHVLPDVSWAVLVSGSYMFNTACRLFATPDNFTNTNDKGLAFDMFVSVNGTRQNALQASAFESGDQDAVYAVDIGGSGTASLHLNAGDVITLELIANATGGLNDGNCTVVGHSTGFVATRVGV